MLISNITPAVRSAYRETWTQENRHPTTRHWDWDQIVATRNADPKQFQLALWNHAEGQPVSTKHLHALAIGRTSSTGAEVRLEYIETYPFGNHPFRGSVFSIVDVALTFYAFVIDARSIKVVNAARTLVKVYESFGYKPENPQAAHVNLVKVIGGENEQLGPETPGALDFPSQREVS